MKALSLTQPMAWAIFHGKDIENRNWNTKFRGRVMIHASQGFNLEHWLWLCRLSDDDKLGIGVGLPDRWAFTHGAIIGEVDIVSVVRNSNSMWFFGPYGFVLRNPVAYEKPIPCKGALGFFEPKIGYISTTNV